MTESDASHVLSNALFTSKYGTQRLHEVNFPESPQQSNLVCWLQGGKDLTSALLILKKASSCFILECLWSTYVATYQKGNKQQSLVILLLQYVMLGVNK